MVLLRRLRRGGAGACQCPSSRRAVDESRSPLAASRPPPLAGGRRRRFSAADALQRRTVSRPTAALDLPSFSVQSQSLRRYALWSAPLPSLLDLQPSPLAFSSYYIQPPRPLPIPSFSLYSLSFFLFFLSLSLLYLPFHRQLHQSLPAGLLASHLFFLPFLLISTFLPHNISIAQQRPTLPRLTVTAWRLTLATLAAVAQRRPRRHGGRSPARTAVRLGASRRMPGLARRQEVPR